VFPIAAFIATALACWGFGASLEIKDYANFGGVVASVGSTMLGFLLASLAVIASINHTHLISMMKKTGHYSDLLKTVFFGCLAFLFCAVLGFIFLFGVLSAPPIWIQILAISLHVMALVSIVDVGRKFWLVLSNLRSN
jgi:hypothetical protein